jgi:hypothetical protein
VISCAPGIVEDTRPDEGKVLVRPDMMKDQVVELELAEVQKLFQVGVDHCYYQKYCYTVLGLASNVARKSVNVSVAVLLHGDGRL